MSFDYYTRLKIVLGLLIFFALLSNFRLLLNARKVISEAGPEDYITLYEKRFDVIREMLPRRGTVGYSGEKMNYAEYWKSDAIALQNWFLTQYTLTPLVVSITSNHKLSIINGSDNGQHSSNEAEGPTIQDLGNDMRLFDFGNGIKVVVTP